MLHRVRVAQETPAGLMTVYRDWWTLNYLQSILGRGLFRLLSQNWQAWTDRRVQLILRCYAEKHYPRVITSRSLFFVWCNAFKCKKYTTNVALLFENCKSTLQNQQRERQCHWIFGKLLECSSVLVIIWKFPMAAQRWPAMRCGRKAASVGGRSRIVIIMEKSV